MYDLVWQNASLWKAEYAAEKIPAPPKDIPISKVALLLWEEHCIECAPPACYVSCNLYVARRDKKCARFAYGIFPNERVSGLFEYGADIHFRRWAKLEANLYGSPQVFPVETVRRYDRWGRGLGQIVNRIGDDLEAVNSRRRVNGLYTFLRSKWTERWAPCRGGEQSPVDGLYIKFFHPGNTDRELQIEVFQKEPIYRTSIQVVPGWNEEMIPFASIGVLPDEKGRISLWPGDDQEIRLIFTWLDFVALPKTLSASADAAASGRFSTRKPAGKVKCLVWDLDNTLWNGIISEAGAESVKPNEKAIALIKKLDERGILQSIASKNTYQEVWPAIEQLGLADHFLYPAINWGRKSESLRKIAASLNINTDSLALIDDSAFERGETAESLPEVRVYEPGDIERISFLDEFVVPVTEASRQRRLSYLDDAKRKKIAASWGNDYEGFLRSCEMRMRIGVPSPIHVPRCLELLQRTNQLNLSARRYSMDEFEALLGCKAKECYVLDCWDKYGNYGTVGFASVDLSESAPTITDFVLSCRVAQKKVEEAFLYWCAYRAQEKGADCLRAEFVPTDRNAPLREILESLPFQQRKSLTNRNVFEFIFSGPIRLPDIITIEDTAERQFRERQTS